MRFFHPLFYPASGYFRKIFSTSDQHYFPVVNNEKKMIGIFSINDIRGVLFDNEVEDLVRMKDVANTSIIYTTPSEDLNEVFKNVRFAISRGFP